MSKRESPWIWVLVMLGPIVVVALLSWLAGCASRPATEREKRGAAEASYGAALQACVEKSETRAESDACADGVRARWADGGAR